MKKAFEKPVLEVVKVTDIMTTSIPKDDNVYVEPIGNFETGS